jgi:hypothetical protein
MLLLARNPRAAEQDTPSTKPARDYPTPKRSITPISPEVVATNRLDQARSGSKIDRSPTDHGANAADHHGGTRLKKWVIGGVKAVIGR